MVQARLCAPTDVESGKDVAFRPVQNVLQLFPIVYRLKGQVFDRRAGDDQPVEFLILDLFKGLVVGYQMLG